MADDKPVEEVKEENVEEAIEEPVEESKVEEAPEPIEEQPVEEPKEEPKPEPEPEPIEDEPAEKPKEKEPAEEPKTEEPAPEKKPPKEETPDAEQPAAEEAPEKKETKPKGPKKAVGLPPDKILLFGKYNMAEVVVKDPGLERYLNLEPIIVAHTGARHANRSFGKSKMHIIERLVNNMMRTENYTGKKTKAYNVVKDAFEIIEKRAKKHPVQVLVEALENSAPREEITRLRYGGISVPKAVDTSSSRRLDIAFRNITHGAVSSSYKSAKSIKTCLANEIILASKSDMNSFAVSKKEEMERIAASAR